MRSRGEGERARYLRRVVGLLLDRGWLLAAPALLDEVGGALQEDADRAALALDETQRVTEFRDGIAAQVFAINKEHYREVDALAAQHEDGAERLAIWREVARNTARRPIARELIRKLKLTPELREGALAKELAAAYEQWENWQ